MFVNQGPHILYLKTNTDKVKGPQTHYPWRSQSRFWFVLSFRQMDCSSGVMHYRVRSLPTIPRISLAPKHFTHWSFCWPRFFKSTINLNFFPCYYPMNTKHSGRVINAHVFGIFLSSDGMTFDFWGRIWKPHLVNSSQKTELDTERITLETRCWTIPWSVPKMTGCHIVSSNHDLTLTFKLKKKKLHSAESNHYQRVGKYL